ncbi:ABC transporter substrate-binding protein [Saccharothrix longispora]|uniref:Multiple sugar transport system substrate-binding protein n=1 Tax=Saccharothrix longispora TaxID=33920 RepID=A0ABU1PRG2_9PSEU|nr:extracellular solute-binding protein [Saccharothrix longispora]MDR6593235.1 multiple sugar transport system substrate-binding protein [Saccharothrix longispora]
MTNSRVPVRGGKALSMLKRLGRLVRVLAAGGLLAVAGCGGASSDDGPVRVSVWAWYPEFKSVVEAFNASHTDVQVEWTNVGTGPDQYAKLKTAFTAGKGAPDVAMVEFQQIPTFVILDALVDMGQYGANDDEPLYAEWAWSQATDGDRVYAIPVDGGPMALMYRKDLFDRHGIPVPTTWDEYRVAAERVKAVDPGAFVASFGSDGGWINGLMWQAGCRPYGYSQAEARDRVRIALTAPECRKVFDFYGDLVSRGLMATDPFFTADATAALDSGKYWTWAAAGWTPGYVAGSLKNTAGKWAVAPMPQWTAGADEQGDWGGSTFTVTKQAKNPEAATKVARELFGRSEEAWDVGLHKAFLYPLVKEVAADPAFTGKPYEFFAGQKVNEIFVPVSEKLDEFQYTPFQDFVFGELNDRAAEAVAGSRPWGTVLEATQENVVAYAEQQGFKVDR